MRGGGERGEGRQKGEKEREGWKERERLSVGVGGPRCQSSLEDVVQEGEESQEELSRQT